MRFPHSPQSIHFFFPLTLSVVWEVVACCHYVFLVFCKALNFGSPSLGFFRLRGTSSFNGCPCACAWSRSVFRLCIWCSAACLHAPLARDGVERCYRVLLVHHRDMMEECLLSGSLFFFHEIFPLGSLIAQQTQLIMTSWCLIKFDAPLWWEGMVLNEHIFFLLWF